MTTTQSAIIGLDDPAARQLPLVGGKGANLAELIAAGFPVPGGFCVDTTGYLARRPPPGWRRDWPRWPGSGRARPRGAAGRADPGGHRGGGAGRLRPAR